MKNKLQRQSVKKQVANNVRKILLSLKKEKKIISYKRIYKESNIDNIYYKIQIFEDFNIEIKLRHVVSSNLKSLRRNKYFFDIFFSDSSLKRLDIIIRKNINSLREERKIMKTISFSLDKIDNSLSESDMIGVKSENRAICALTKLKKENKIVDFMETGKFSSLDLKGIDFIIIFINRGIRDYFGIQIKSSRRYQEEHKIRYPFIPSVIVSDRPMDKIENMIIKIKELYKKGVILHL